ncbi:hypothetical protein [Roseibium sp.]|uniref:hypothetical protein n=1 Tax=Roseibium sp. TaxID=1936156 RepID=UPI003B518332
MVRRIVEDTLLSLTGFAIGVVIGASLMGPEDTLNHDLKMIDWLLDRGHVHEEQMIEIRYATFDFVERPQ